MHLLNKLPTYVRVNTNNFNDLKFILVEGEIVSVAGFLSYNAKVDEFQLTNPISIAQGGCNKLMDKAISLYSRNKTYLLGLFAFGVALSSICYLLSQTRYK